MTTSDSEETEFSKWLDQELDTPGVNPNDVAREAGISQGYLSLLRHAGRKTPSNKVLRALAGALKVKPEVVFKKAEKVYSPLDQEELRPADPTNPKVHANRIQECSARTERAVLQVQISIGENGEGRVRVQFVNSKDATMADGLLKWFVNGELTQEFSTPVVGVTAQIFKGMNELVGEWGGERLTLKFHI